ncbi:MAG: hypothetical protein AAGE61_04825 [Pseudomonadota bacterium]
MTPLRSLTVQLALVLGAIFGTISLTAVTVADTKPAHLRLIDRLDRPIDGYCIDILGTPGNLRLDVPIFAHNCKGTLTEDSAIIVDDQGRIEFFQVGLCITAAGVNGRALPGASILLRGCGSGVSFFNAAPLQTFEFDDGRLRLRGSNLCLAAGEISDRTYSSADRWRVLSVEDCDRVAEALSRWELNFGPFPTP